MPQKATFTTTVHPFPSPTPHACAYEIGLQNATNALVFVGGLGDGPHTVPYPRAIAKKLEEYPSLGYSVFEFRLKSSFSAFGFARLVDDVADISALVKYLRSIGRKRVVLMGHSTGCQDCMEYAAPAHDVPNVDGYILQAPACDRDAFALDMGREKLDKSLEVAKQLIDAGRRDERMPMALLPETMQDTPMSVWRWYALGASDGEDNYFSPDLSDDTATPYWERIDKPLLILHSANDEFVPKSVDKEGLVRHWRKLCKPGIVSKLSGTIPEANHRVEEPMAEAWLCNTVIEFVQTIK
ncbi:hypothetical protein GGR50DRAFT_613471 [Xylaria sp. CBS 124048]|nr:hypothetical protein GGR50DRAFT_613471 [Xylaria sp. CBS 124048]